MMNYNTLTRYIHSMNENFHRSFGLLSGKSREVFQRYGSRFFGGSSVLIKAGRTLGNSLSSNRKTRNVFTWILGILVGAGALFLMGPRGSVLEGATPVYTVQPELFQMKILERGTLKSVRNVMITSGMTSDRGKILQLFPEGNFVKKGQLLVKFDRTPFEEEIERGKTELQRAKAELVQAQEDLKAERARIEENIKRAADNIKLAELDLKDLQEGSGPLRIQKAKFTMEKNKAEFEKLEKDFNEFKELVKEGYVSQSELESIGYRRDESKSSYEFSKADYENLVNFTYPGDLEAAKAKSRAAKEAHIKLQETAEYSIASKGASVSRAMANINAAQTKINIARDQLSRTEITATVDGFVIYPEMYIAGSSDRRKVEIGDVVFPTQAFMYIPDTSEMYADTQIREVDIYKVKSGQEVIVRVDAYPDLILKGTVALVGTLAEGRIGEGGGGKYFNLQVSLKKSDSRLRPGMTARVEILVDEEEDVMMVPMEAVSEINGNKVVYVRSGRSVEQRRIQTDKSNEDFVVVRNGLSSGDKVLLLNPEKEMNSFDQRINSRPGGSRSETPEALPSGEGPAPGEAPAAQS